MALTTDELDSALLRYATTPQYYTLPAGTRVAISEEADECEAALQCFLSSSPGALGLDTEWADAAGTIALLQLATRSAGCLIIRLPRLTRMPGALRQLLADEDLVKCGVGVAHDLRLLEAQFSLQSKGFVDLQPLACRHDKTQHGLGLSAICRGVLGVSMNKVAELRQSDWSGELSQKQVEYAACDAFVAVEILEKMHCDHNPDCAGLRTWCGDILDRAPKGLKLPASQSSELRRKNGSKRSSVVHAPRRQSELYGGCRLLSPSGLHLANVSSGKADWYIKQGLAERLDNDGGRVVVRLNFEPKGVGHAGDAFYLQVMENQCVGCGSREHLVRFSIVPHVFRSLLPLRFKEHSSHDIVLLCHSCYIPASDASQERRRQLLRSCGLVDAATASAPGRYSTDQEKLKVRGAAVALKHPRLPTDIRLAKEAIVRAYLGKGSSEELTDADLATARNVDPKVRIDGYVSPEAACAVELGIAEDTEQGDAIALEQRCFDFVVGWRQCLLDSVRPRFLCAGWDLHRSIRKHDDLFGPGNSASLAQSEGAAESVIAYKQASR